MFLDLRFAFRLLRKSPVFLITAALSLALGIGATTTVFSAFRAVFLRPLPYTQPDQLVEIGKQGPDGRDISVNDGDVQFWRQFSKSMSSFGAYTFLRALNMTGSGDAANVVVRGAGPDLFSTLGVHAAAGRVFGPGDFEAGARRTLLLTWKLWQERFQGDPGVSGRTILLDGEAYTIIGALGEDFRFAGKFHNAWIPDRDIVKDLFLSGRSVVARLKPGVTPQQAKEELERMRGSLAQQYPETRRDFHLTTEQLGQRDLSNYRGAFRMLLGSVALLALIACLNVANLMIARSVSREGEFAVRNALGAGRGRLIRQVLSESLLLALFGGGAGLGLALLGNQVLSKWLPKYQISRLAEMRIDPQVLGFALGLTLLTSLVFGIGPAFALSRLSMRELSRTATAAVSRVRARGILITAEVALSMTLLTGSGLLIRSFVTLASVNPGFRPDHVLTAMIPASTQLSKDKPRLERRLATIIGAVSQLPGVSDAGLATAIPMGSVNVSLLFTLYERPGQEVGVNFRAVSPGYLRAMGTTLLQGRFFSEADSADAPHVIIVNEAFVRKYWPGQNPIGKLVPDDKKSMTVIGLVADSHARALDAPADPEVLGHYRQYLGPSIGAMLVIRTNGDPVSLGNAVRRSVNSLFPDQPVTDVSTMEMRVSDSMREPRLYMWLLAMFAGVALTLTAIGIYGVISYSVGQRTREFGIRMALGARRNDVLALVMRRGVALAVTGVGLGFVGAWSLSRYLGSLLFGVSPRDPLAFGAAAISLVFFALIACYAPARRATTVNPNSALRQE